MKLRTCLTEWPQSALLSGRQTPRARDVSRWPAPVKIESPIVELERGIVLSSLAGQFVDKLALEVGIGNTFEVTVQNHFAHEFTIPLRVFKAGWRRLQAGVDIHESCPAQLLGCRFSIRIHPSVLVIGEVGRER